jgi:hypothetical protein
MDSADGGAAGAVAVVTSAEKKQGRKAPGGLKTPKDSNNFGHQNPLHAAKFDGGVRKPELAGGTPSPRKKAQDKEDSSLNRLDRKKAFAAVKGRHGVNDASDAEAEVLIKDDSDDDNASGKRLRCKTRTTKGGRSADDPADRVNDGHRPTKAPPKSRRGIPMHAAVGGRGVPVHAVGRRGIPVHAVIGGRGAPPEIAGGSSGDDASLTSKDDFASKEEDNEHNPDNGLAGVARFAHDEIAVKARFALGFWPSNEARAAAAGILDAEVVRGVVAALRDSSSALAARATISNDVEFDKRSEAGANWHAKQGDPIDDAGGATKQETHRTRGPQVLTADEETDVETNWQANQGSDPSKQVGWAAKRSADHKSAAKAATQRKSKHVAHRGCGRHSPQV